VLNRSVGDQNALLAVINRRCLHARFWAQRMAESRAKQDRTPAEVASESSTTLAEETSKKQGLRKALSVGSQKWNAISAPPSHEYMYTQAKKQKIGGEVDGNGDESNFEPEWSRLLDEDLEDNC